MGRLTFVRAVWYHISMTLQDTLLEQKAPIPLVGVSFCPDGIAKIAEGRQVRVMPDPDNPHDPCSLRVTLMSGEPLGYLPAKLAHRLVTSATSPSAYLGRVAKVHTYYGKNCGGEIILERVIPETSRLRQNPARAQ